MSKTSGSNRERKRAVERRRGGGRAGEEMRKLTRKGLVLEAV